MHFTEHAVFNKAPDLNYNTSLCIHFKYRKMNAIHTADTYTNIKETIKEGNLFKQCYKRNSTF